MKIVPILNIEQFEHEESTTSFYSNNLKQHLKENETIVYKPHKHDFFLCVLFLKGSGVHEVDFNSYPIERGSVFFLQPGQTHCWEFHSPPQGYIFFHTRSFYEFSFSNTKLTQFPFYYSYKNPPHLSLTTSEVLRFAKCFDEINVEYHQESIYKEQKLASLITIIYIDLSRLYADFGDSKKNSSPTYLKTIEVLDKLIETGYKTQKSAQFYANELNITPKHLNRITKTTINKTTTELITERILLEAKRLIVHSNNSLTTIAELLGYEDYAYFSRVFKSKTGSSPLAFKKRYDRYKV
ncbi:helix-turn-helix transcriptional regulator [uncultured Kriegella sp.]|uniref:helix-turn-helix domain-containing protein n=1 Tax=uncultured Kriegella sp. TaxID=1798910 RepID=UPI0030DD3309|tara:strand:- start:235472 stop:236359 length:888 start_codon:yes stop_codon:yes gene_type:complete